MKRVILILLFASCSTATAQVTTQVSDWGVSLARRTEHIPRYELAMFDNIGSFGPPTSSPFRLVTGRGVFDEDCFCFVFTPPAPECVPIVQDGVYTISARGVWSIDSTRTGVRELSIRVLRDSVWSVLAEDVEPKVGNLPAEQIQQTVMTMDALLAGDCVGTLAWFRSNTRELNFGVTSFLFSKATE